MQCQNSMKFYLLTIVLSSFSSRVGVSASSCNGIIGAIASDVVNFPLAQSWCSSKFPLALVTSTSTAAATTATVTVATSTATTAISTATTFSTVSTSTATTTTTITDSTTVSTTTSVIGTTTTLATTTTSTSTVTISPNAGGASKRQASTSASQLVRAARSRTTSSPSVNARPNTTSKSTTMTNTRSAAVTSTTSTQRAGCNGDPRACAFSSILSAADALAGSICTCIETASTTTLIITPTSTISVTATVTTSVTSTTTVLTIATTTTIATTATTTTFTNTITNVGTATTTTTSTATATRTYYIHTSPKPRCGPDGSGCTGQYCKCTIGYSGGGNGVFDTSQNVCTRGDSSGIHCNNDNDCPDGQACVFNGLNGSCYIYGAEDYFGTNYPACGSTYQAQKRSIFGLLGAEPKGGRMRRKVPSSMM